MCQIILTLGTWSEMADAETQRPWRKLEEDYP